MLYLQSRAPFKTRHGAAWLIKVKIARAPNSSILLRAKYVDEAAIGKACAPGATPPDEVAEDTVGLCLAGFSVVALALMPGRWCCTAHCDLQK